MTMQMTQSTKLQPTRPVYLSRHALLAWMGPATFEQVQTARLSLLAFLRSDRLENYGYDWRDFRRLQGQRQRVKANLKTNVIGILGRACDEERLGYCPERDQWEYTTGQSQNEEITNLIARLSGYKNRGWLS